MTTMLNALALTLACTTLALPLWAIIWKDRRNNGKP
jgi:hypothetical protein